MSLNHQDIQSIIKLLDDTAYDELRLDQDGYSLYLKRTASGWTQTTQTQLAPKLHTGLAPAVATTAAAPAVSEPAATEQGLVEIRSPMVGTFYRAPQPGAAPFVDIGTVVNPNSIIAIIEAMKLMSSIPALQSGTVKEILAKDSQLVEKGQLLMRVKPASA